MGQRGLGLSELDSVSFVSLLRRLRLRLRFVRVRGRSRPPWGALGNTRWKSKILHEVEKEEKQSDVMWEGGD